MKDSPNFRKYFLYTILQIFNVSLFEKAHICHLLTDDSLQTFECNFRKQLKLFKLSLDTYECKSKKSSSPKL